MMESVLAVGDVSHDISVRIPRFPGADEKVLALETAVGTGGVAANAARAVAQAGMSATLASAIGTDPAGQEIVKGLASYGVDTRMRTVEGASAWSQSWIDDSGEKRLVLSPGIGLYPDIAFVRELPVESFDWVHTAAYNLEAATELARMCSERSTPLSLDLEPATIPERFEDIAEILRACSLVFVNSQAKDHLARLGVDLRVDLGISTVVETQGPRGALLLADGLSIQAPTVSGGRVIDTTGAGDCLAGWYIARTLDGEPPERAIRAAVTAASLSCSHLGGAGSFPDRDAVDEYISNASRKET